MSWLAIMGVALAALLVIAIVVAVVQGLRLYRTVRRSQRVITTHTEGILAGVEAAEQTMARIEAGRLEQEVAVADLNVSLAELKVVAAQASAAVAAVRGPLRIITGLRAARR